jgi:hypothetical protein
MKRTISCDQISPTRSIVGESETITRGPPIRSQRLIALKCAWVVAVRAENAPKALALARSLKKVRTLGDIVCMMAADVSGAARGELAKAYTHVFPYAGDTKNGGRVDLTRWDRVILADAQMEFLVNCDELFSLKPPAACFTPANEKLHHGSRVPADMLKLSKIRSLELHGPSVALFRDKGRQMVGIFADSDWTYIHPKYAWEDVGRGLDVRAHAHPVISGT